MPLLVVPALAAITAPAASAALPFADMFRGKAAAISETMRRGDLETYVTGYAWHLPHGYQDQARARLNETTWGGGFGRTLRDEDGDRHSVFVMGFSDSHREAQFNLGYAWQRYWRPTRNLGVGGGYLAFLFSRRDVAKNVPIPALLPCASLRYRSVEVIGLFVPRISQDIKGDVLFVYLRVPFGNSRLRESRGPGNAERSGAKR